MKPRDVITEYNGRTVGRSEDLPRAVAETPIGRDVTLIVRRDRERVTLTARIAPLEEPERQVTRRRGGPRS